MKQLVKWEVALFMLASLLVFLLLAFSLEAQEASADSAIAFYEEQARQIRPLTEPFECTAPPSLSKRRALCQAYENPNEVRFIFVRTLYDRELRAVYHISITGENKLLWLHPLWRPLPKGAETQGGA